jgi:hypothetical protein
MAAGENIVTYESMLIGFTDAAARFDAAAAERNPITATNALFETLNWAVALEDRIRQHWAPDGKPLNWKWRKRLGRGVPEIMGGVRFARNRVHHQWSDAMVVNTRTLPYKFPLLVPEWIWRPTEDLPKGDSPDPAGEAGYREYLDGRPVKLCLDILNGAFYTLQFWLEPHTARAPGRHDLRA